MFACPTYSLIDRIFTFYQEKLMSDKDQYFTRDKLQIYATALINPEPLMLQVSRKHTLYLNIKAIVHIK
jgi:hypothetical protein